MPPPTLVKAAKTYEELEGGQGREVFFRPERFRADDLNPLKAHVLVHRSREPFRCVLHDVSQSGTAVEWPRGVAVETGDRLERIQVVFDDYCAFNGEARVGSVRDEQGAIIVGLSFADGALLDTDEVLHLRDIRGWHGQNKLGISLAQKPWAIPGHHDFKVRVSELALFLQDSQWQLGELEANLAWHVVHGNGDSPARRALLERLEREFVAEVVRYSDEIDASLREVPPGDVARLKQFSLHQVQKYLMQSPCLYRALHKPFGYPGDYEVMRFIYERQFEGATLFAKAVQLSFLRTGAPTAVRTRKDLMKAQLRRLIDDRRGEDRPLRLLSVAAGSAQELLELLSELTGPCPPLEIVLFDQDKSALAYAYRRLKPVVDARWSGRRVSVLYLHDSIKRLLRDPRLFEEFGLFDVIFSVGLFDYLQSSTAVVLGRNLFARLAHGGSLYIGNMVPENPTRWIMEHHLDWYLIYRSREEMREIGRRAAPEAAQRIVDDETRVNPFLQITRE